MQWKVLLFGLLSFVFRLWSSEFSWQRGGGDVE